MEEEDAKTLLRKRLPDDKSSENDTIALVEILERIPLAITQAAAYISTRKTRMTIAKYLAHAQQDEEILLKDTGDLRRDPGMPNSVLVTWQISFDQIKKQFPPAAELLSLMSVLDRQGIPEFLLCKGDNRLVFEDALAPLNDFALITSEDDGECFGMHRLVQLATRAWLHVHGEITKWEKEAVELLSESFPTGDHENWKICVALLPHAEAVLTYQYSEQRYSLQQTKVLYNTAWYLSAQGKYDLALGRSKEVLNTYRRFLNEEDLNVIHSLDLTAGILSKQGKYEEAEAMSRRTLALEEKISGIEHPDTLTSMNDLALVLDGQGKYEEAETMNRRTLALYQKKLGTEHPFTLTSMNNLALILNNQGKYEEAEAMYRRTLALHETVLGTEHPDTLTSVWCFANLLQSQKRYQNAFFLYQRASTGYQKVLGPSHPETLRCLKQHKFLIELMKQQGFVEER